MKKILLAVVVLIFASSWCFAQEASVPVSKPTIAPVEIKTLTGKVDSVKIEDSTKGKKSELVVVADNGQKLSLVVKISTPIINKGGNAIALSDIKKGDKVTVEYTITESGTNKAHTIQIVE